jgi:L-lysine 6-transaminase
MAGGKLDEITDHVFAVSGRLNSTWGGSLTDMVRAKHILAAIETENLIEHAAELGTWLLGELEAIAGRQKLLTSPRGRGLLAAFSLPDTATRARFLEELLRRGVIMLGCGDRSVRFRPPLVVTQDELRRGLDAIEETLAAL